MNSDARIIAQTMCEEDVRATRDTPHIINTPDEEDHS